MSGVQDQKIGFAKAVCLHLAVGYVKNFVDHDLPI